jgi:predicted small lipoprotein YifL
MRCWARSLLFAVVAVLGIGQMIAACGQKGDLYLPEKGTQEQKAADTKSEDVPQGPTGERPRMQGEKGTAPEAADKGDS